MANTGSLVVGLIYILSLSVLIQGSLVLSEENIEPNAQRVPEKIEHGEKGSAEYNVDTIELTGNQHTKVDDETHPPWPPRPGRRSFISIKAKKAMPTIIRPGRIIHDSFIFKEKRSPQVSWPKVLRPGKDDIPQTRPSLFRPGREDVPKKPPTLFRPGREDVPKKPPTLFRPGREDVPQGGPTLFRPGRESVRRQFPKILRPGRSDVPEPQHSVVRPGKRNIDYNMPWTYVGSSVNANVHQKSHTFRQKAQEQLAKKAVHAFQQEMSDPSSLEDEPQDF